MLLRSFKMFEEVENYKYCKAGKEHTQAEIVSVKEEVEQDFINRSITNGIYRRMKIALLPLMFIRCKALCVYNQQLKKLNQKPQDEEDVLQSEAKL